MNLKPANSSRVQALPYSRWATNRIGSVLLFLAPFILLHNMHAATDSALSAGVAAVDITPPLGAPMAGYYHARGADGVLDPLFSKVIVFDAQGQRAALITLDLISVTRQITDQARALISQQSGISGDRVMISATHAHTGPELAERGQRSISMGGNAELALTYTQNLPALIAQSVQQALTNLQPVRLLRSTGSCEGLAFNRRYFMRDGSVGWNPGRLNPNIVMPAGPTDPQVGLLRIERIAGSTPEDAVATYVNFAMHPDTTGGSKFSADWPGALGRVLAGYHGSNHLTLVGNGTCGNINHLDFSWAAQRSGPNEPLRIATILGASVFQAHKSLQPLASVRLEAQTTRVELPLPTVTEAEVAEARQTAEATKDDRGANFMKLVRAYRVLDIAARQGKPFSVEVQAIALGQELAWVSLPGEVFVELGLAIKKRSPFAQTMVVELANECIGYIPDRRSFAEGNYEPESARCSPGAGEKLVEAACSLLSALHAEAGSRKDIRP